MEGAKRNNICVRDANVQGEKQKDCESFKANEIHRRLSILVRVEEQGVVGSRKERYRGHLEH